MMAASSAILVAMASVVAAVLRAGLRHALPDRAMADIISEVGGTSRQCRRRTLRTRVQEGSDTYEHTVFLPATDGGDDIEWTCSQPAGLLEHITERCAAYGSLVEKSGRARQGRLHRSFQASFLL